MIKFTLKGNRVLLQCENKEQLDVIRNRFTVPNPNVKYSPHAPLTLCPITPLGSFRIGLFTEIFTACEELYPFDKIEIEKEISNKAYPKIKKSDTLIPVENTKYIYRDYQENAIKKALQFGRGVILLPTRSGKSLVMYGIIKNAIAKKILILVPNIQLVKQMSQDLVDYGCDENLIQVFSGYSNNIVDKNGIYITNSQYLLKHPDELPKCDMMLIDEVHQIKKGNKISKWVEQQKQNVVFGFTGTLPESQEDIWNIKGLVGCVLYEEKITDLQEKKYLADVKIYPIRIKHKVKEQYIMEDGADIVEHMKNKFRWEYGVLENCTKANEVIIKLAESLQGNTLILFDHIEHGHTLFDMIKSDDKCFVDGGVKLNDREITKAKMSEKGNTITVGNYKCIGTGITFSEIQNIILAGSGKGVTKIIQGLGRGLYRSKENLYIFDISHDYTYSKRHFNERLKLYKEFYNIDNPKTKVVNI